MSNGTPIEWTDATWPIVAGCEKASPGCKNCWAIRDSWRLAHNPNPKVSKVYKGTVHKVGTQLAWTGLMRPIPERLMWPIKWRRPRRIFVCSQSDLFHPNVPFDFIDQVFAVMGMVRRHTFQVLTKHPERLQEDSSLPERARSIGYEQFAIANANPRALVDHYTGTQHTQLPFENVWLGFSAENQRYYDERWAYMEDLTRAGWLTWASLEPLLGSIDLKTGATVITRNKYFKVPLLQWVVAGGESGPKARPSHPDWYRQLRDQCAAAGIPFLFKQWGNWLPDDQVDADGKHCQDEYDPEENPSAFHDWPGTRPDYSVRIRKGEAGRDLDGREHSEFPTT